MVFGGRRVFVALTLCTQSKKTYKRRLNNSNSKTKFKIKNMFSLKNKTKKRSEALFYFWKNILPLSYRPNKI